MLVATQLLVVGAEYPEPVLMQQRLDAGQFLEACMDLQCAAETAGKWFIQDLGADGLHATCERNELFDIVQKGGGDHVILDGDWTRQTLTEVEYRTRFEAAEGEYVRLLTLVAAAIRHQS